MLEIYDQYSKLQVSSNNSYNVGLVKTESTDNEIHLDGRTYYVGETSLTDKLYAIQVPTKGVVSVHYNTNWYLPGQLEPGIRSWGQGAGAADAKVYIFEFSPQINSTEYGVQVTDAQGKISFTSASASLNVIDHIKISNMTGNNFEYMSKEYKRTYGTTQIAILPNKIPFMLQPSAGNHSTPGQFWSAMWYLDKNSDLCFCLGPISYGPPNEYGLSIGDDLDFLVIDVSHFN